MTTINTSKTTWDLSPLLAGDDDPKIKQYRQSITKSTDTFVKKWRGRDDYLQDPKVLREALDELEQWERQPGAGNEGFYFHMQLVRDAANPTYQAKNSQAVEFFQEIMTKTQFFWLNVSKIASDKQAAFLAAPELKPYRHLIEREFTAAAHNLGEAEEKIMLLKSSVAHDKWEEMTTRFLSAGERQVVDEQGKKVTATLETMTALLSSRTKSVRDAAAAQFNDYLTDYLEVAEAEIDALLTNKKIDDQLRRYERPDSARHLADDIDTTVVDVLLEAVSSRNDISQRYYALKAKLLGLPKLAYHERNVPYGTVEKSYSFDDAVKLTDEVFQGVDPEFAEIFRRLMEAGQVDVYPRKGKQGGAFCTINGINHPVYVMLNFTNKLSDVTTIAHEFGHAINHELSKRQNALNYGISLATAEVASNFMEGQVLMRLMAEADDELRLALMVDQLNSYVSGIHRQAAFYRFEQALHAAFRKRGHLTHQDIGALFQEQMEAYMGPAVEQSPGAQNWWIYVGHFRHFFYVYSYVSGDLIARALQAKVKQNPAFIKDIKEKFLSAGTTHSVKDVFAGMGIDITDRAFWEEGLNEIDQLLQQTEALAQKLGKI